MRHKKDESTRNITAVLILNPDYAGMSPRFFFAIFRPKHIVIFCIFIDQARKKDESVWNWTAVSNLSADLRKVHFIWWSTVKKIFLSSRAKSRPATCPSGARRMSPRKGSQQFLPRWAIRKMNRGTKNNDFGENPQIKTSAGRVGAKKLTKASLLTIGDRCRGSWALFENSIEVSDVGSEDHRKSFVKAVEDSNLLEII